MVVGRGGQICSLWQFGKDQTLEKSGMLGNPISERQSRKRVCTKGGGRPHRDCLAHKAPQETVHVNGSNNVRRAGQEARARAEAGSPR